MDAPLTRQDLTAFLTIALNRDEGSSLVRFLAQNIDAFARGGRFEDSALVERVIDYLAPGVGAPMVKWGRTLTQGQLRRIHRHASLEMTYDPETLLALAERPDAPADVHLEIAADADLALEAQTETAAELIAFHTAHSNVLDELSGHDLVTVRARVAGNRASAAETLRRLARDSDGRVRAAVAGNRSCPPDVLDDLAEDPDDDVSLVVGLRR